MHLFNAVTVSNFTTGSDTLRFVMIGSTGTGKSALGNSIVGVTRDQITRPFLSKPSTESVTAKCQKEEGVINGQKIEIVDTPGFFDTKMTFEQTLDEVAESILMLDPGPHAILVVMRIDRSTDEVIKGIELMKKIFGPDSFKFMIVVFTGRDNLEHHDLNIEQYLKTVAAPVQKLLEDCGMRYIPFNNMLKPSSEENKKQVFQLISMVKKLLKANSETYYTIHLLKKARDIADEEKRRIQEIEREKANEEERKLKLEIERQNRKLEEMKEEQRHIQEEDERERGSLERVCILILKAFNYYDYPSVA